MGNLAILAIFAAVCSANAVQPHISVLVFNYAVVPPTMLRTAEAEADRVLTSSDVGLVWIECSVDPAHPGPDRSCLDKPRPSELLLHILPAGVTRRQTDVNALGFATVTSGTEFAYYAGIFYDRIVQIARGPQASALLGHTIAHELGHLLLGAGQHSNSGIMKPDWGRNELALENIERFRFSAAERRRIARNVQLRITRAKESATRRATKEVTTRLGSGRPGIGAAVSSTLSAPEIRSSMTSAFVGSTRLSASSASSTSTTSMGVLTPTRADPHRTVRGRK